MIAMQHEFSSTQIKNVHHFQNVTELMWKRPYEE